MLIPTLVTAIALTVALGGSSPAGVDARRQNQTPPVFFVRGHGWGHGVGLSQYGAYGFALHGWKYDRIVRHYYPGTTLGPAPLAKVRVLIGAGRTRVTVTSKQAFTVKDGAGNSYVLDAGAYAFGPGFKLKVDPDKPPKALTGPLTFDPGASPLSLDLRAYRGSFRVSRDGSKLQVVNVVGLDRYLWGVVPSEMPKTWALEALKAQAVVARSYALAHLRGSGSFDLYDDTRSQVYLGIPHESPATTTAVNATAGKVLLYRGRVADAFFFSTSGGRTASAEDVWPGGTPVPYLVSVRDPYDSISPYHDWGPFRYTARKLGRALRAPGRLLDAQTLAGSSGRVRTVTAVGSNGQNTLTGDSVRRALGLRSTWFSIGVLSIGAPDGAIVYGARAKLTGTARGEGRFVLQQRAYGGSWQPAGPLSPRNGTVAPVVKPKISTQYRLYVDGVVSGSVRVDVASALRLHVPNDRTGFWGTVRPAGEGVVEVQRLTPSGWVRSVRAALDARGRFEARIAVGPGSYRASIAGRDGYAPGLSPVVRVAG